MLKILDICKKIPTSWRDATDLVKFQQVDTLTFTIGLKVSEQKTNFQCMKSRQLYEFFVKELQESYSLQIRDGQSNFDFTDKETSKHFIRSRSTTLVRKQREFQFMLLHGVIYTKEQLLKFGFVMDNLCSFCQRETETYSHLFLQCVNVKQIWQYMIEDFDLAELRNLEWKDIFLGLSGNSNRIKCINTLIILLKYTILKNRTGSTLPSKAKICKIVRDFIEEEKNLAIKAGRIHLHLQKREELKIH